MNKALPTVMCFSGLDPTGGAGIQADIEAVASMGAHCCPVITAHTVQTTSHALRYVAQDPILLIEQARAVLDDMPVQAFKLGMLGDVKIIEAVHSLLHDYALPVVFDPVLSAGGGGPLHEDQSLTALRELILPLTTILTPNSLEARQLAPEADNLDACASALQDLGCDFVLITGGHEPEDGITNTLYGNHRVMETFHWTRLPGEFHGSGCTLSASLAGLLAHGLEPFTAVHEAQQYTWHTLQAALQPTAAQAIPNRLYWAREEQE